jgi:hypothetical protein
MDIEKDGGSAKEARHAADDKTEVQVGVVQKLGNTDLAAGEAVEAYGDAATAAKLGYVRRG